jgi:hypothetical protein
MVPDHNQAVPPYANAAHMPWGSLPPWTAWYPPAGMQPPPMQPPTVPSPSMSSHTLDRTRTRSSDSGYDDDKEKYPSISEFFSNLVQRHPHRSSLSSLTYSFEAQDLYSINEIATFSEDKLRSEFDVTLGNAQFILEQVKKEIKRVDRINQKKRARRD